MRAICFCVAIGMFAGPVAAFEAPTAEAGDDCRSYRDSGESPHAMAIRLVMTQRVHEIAALDDREIQASPERSPWFDTKKRNWVAHRWSSPGTIDTTHMISVEYQIEDVPVATWQVDLAAQRVFGKGETFSPCRN